MKGEPALSDESEEIIDIHPVVLGEKRIPKESARAYAAFVEFCAMPQPRSLERFVRYRAEAGVRVHLASVKQCQAGITGRIACASMTAPAPKFIVLVPVATFCY